MIKWIGAGAIILTVFGMYYVGKNEVDSKPLSIYDLAYEANNQDYSPQTLLETGEVENLALKKKWNGFNNKMALLSQEKFISSLTALNSEHKLLLNQSLKEGYALDPLEITPPTLRWVSAKKLNVELSELRSEHIMNLEAQAELWRELQINSNNLRYLAATN